VAQHYLRQPTVQRLPSLLEELKAGELRIPPFQRDFVWTGEQRLHLLDSVYRGLPAGSIMVWRTTKGLKTDPRLGPVHLSVPEPTEGAMRQYLLDGRQRLTTLFAALAPGLWSRDDSSLPEGWEPEAPDGTPWAMFFDLDEPGLFFEEREKEDGPRRLPLALLLDDFAFDEWLRKEGGANKKRWNVARGLKSAVVDYLIPVTPLHTDDLVAVTLTFKRVNRAGTPMGDLAMTRALSWTQGGFDLEAEIDELLLDLRPDGWGELGSDTVLKILASVTGQEPMSLDIERLAASLKEDTEHLVRLKRVMKDTVRLFNDMGIAGPATLPYERAFITAAWALHDLRDAWSDDAHEVLKAWLAETCITEAFASAPPHVLRAMHREVLALVRSGDTRGTRTPRREARRCRKFSMAWARSRIAAVALARLGPLRADGTLQFASADPKGGGTVNNAPRVVGEEGNRVIAQLLDARGSGLVDPSRRRENEELPPHYRSAAANRILCAPEALPALRRALLNRDPRVCKSHAVPIDWTNLAELIDKRDQLLWEAEKEWLRAQGTAPDGTGRWKWKQEPLLKNIKP